MYYILEINNVLFNIYDKTDGNKQGLIHLFKLSHLNSNIVLKKYHNGYMRGLYRIKNNQILYLKESNNTLTAELQATKHSMNNLRKSYLKLKKEFEK